MRRILWDSPDAVHFFRHELEGQSRLGVSWQLGVAQVNEHATAQSRMVLGPAESDWPGPASVLLDGPDLPHDQSERARSLPRGHYVVLG
jgi:hypothetical protein